MNPPCLSKPYRVVPKHHQGISAAGLDSPLGDLGPPVVGTIAATLIFIPLSALALRERHGRVAARQSIAASSRQRPA